MEEFDERIVSGRYETFWEEKKFCGVLVAAWERRGEGDGEGTGDDRLEAVHGKGSSFIVEVISL